MTAPLAHENSLLTTARDDAPAASEATLPEGWLAVESLDIDAQGIARRPDAKSSSSKALCPLKWSAPACTARRTIGKRASSPPSTANPRSACARAARISACTRRLRWLQDAAPARERPGGDQATCAGGQPLAPGQGQGADHAAAHRRAGLGLPLPRAPVGAFCAQERRGADRFSRAQEPLRGRHAGLPCAAAACECDVGAAAWADLRHGRARNLPADRTGLWRRRDRPGAAPSGAAVGRRPHPSACLRCPARCAVVAAIQRAGHREAARRGRPPVVVWFARFRHHHAVQTHRFHPGQSAHQPRAGLTRLAPARCTETRARDRLVLWAGQFHLADRHAGGRSAGD
ncbi:hypothetical protein Y695_02082 [Hydrogenophaga sp. T4]|nr:hypothetical protein Y695_02082 [Hydrogenophaga sp. T4]